jgi:hypothetical protein
MPISNILLVVKKKFASDENFPKYDADNKLQNTIKIFKKIKKFFFLNFKKNKKIIGKKI